MTGAITREGNVLGEPIKVPTGANDPAEIWPSLYKSGMIEDYISGSGVSKIYKSISGKEKTSFEIYNLALAGNKDALQTK
jgi:glucokinase